MLTKMTFAGKWSGNLYLLEKKTQNIVRIIKGGVRDSKKNTNR